MRWWQQWWWRRWRRERWRWRTWLWVNSLHPGRSCWNFRCVISNLFICGYLQHFPLNLPSDGCQVTSMVINQVMPDGTKPLSVPMLTQLYVCITRPQWVKSEVNTYFLFLSVLFILMLEPQSHWTYAPLSKWFKDVWFYHNPVKICTLVGYLVAVWLISL